MTKVKGRRELNKTAHMFQNTYEVGTDTKVTRK